MGPYFGPQSFGAQALPLGQASQELEAVIWILALPDILAN